MIMGECMEWRKSRVAIANEESKESGDLSSSRCGSAAGRKGDKFGVHPFP